MTRNFGQLLYSLVDLDLKNVVKPINGEDFLIKCKVNHILSDGRVRHFKA